MLALSFADICAGEPHSVAIEIAIARRDLCVGMTPAEVVRAWGEPDAKPIRGEREQWLYANRCAYIYFRNGRLVSWQEPKTP